MNSLPPPLSSLFTQHQGMLTAQAVAQAGLPAHWLSYYTKQGLLERSQRGVYRLLGHAGTNQDHLLELALRIPKGVICSLSALAFHQLGTQIPTAIHLAIPHKARRPRLEYPALELYHLSPKIFLHGIQTHTIGAGQIQVYSPEKTLADVLHFSHRIEYGIALEAIKSYLNRKNHNLEQLFLAAQICHVEAKMKQIVQILLA